MVQRRRRPGFTYWFPARESGWGWGLPVTWQGWIVLDIYLVCFIGTLFIALFGGGSNAFFGLVGLILATTMFIYTCYKKGEPPRRR